MGKQEQFDRFEQHDEHDGDLAAVRELDGAERVAMLPIARYVAIAPGMSIEEPPYVFIEWAPGVVERPHPGSAIWRAVLQRFITEPVRADVSQRVLRPLIAACLERYPTLASAVRRRVPRPGHRVPRGGDRSPREYPSDRADDVGRASDRLEP